MKNILFSKSKSHLTYLCSALAVTGTFAAAVHADCNSDNKANHFKNPYTYTSAHHRPIGTGATYSANGSVLMNALHKHGFGNVNPGQQRGGGFTAVTSTNSDTVKTVVWNGTGNQNQFPVTLRYPSTLNTTNADAVVIIYDPIYTGLIHDFYHWSVNTNGQASASNHFGSSITGTGHPPSPGTGRVGVSASGVEGLFGLMRGWEVNLAGCKIEHVAQFTYPADGTVMDNVAVWPAGFIDGYAGNYSGPIPYGALLAIPPTTKGGPNLGNLGLSAAGLRLAQQLRDYGGYIIDTTGSSSVNMRADQAVTVTIRDQLTADMKKLWPYVRVVTNNAKSQTASGGGTPLAPNSAYNAP